MCSTFLNIVAACALVELGGGMRDELLDGYAFPGLIQAMLKWPDQQTLESDRRVRPPKAGRFPPLDHSLDWINRLLDPNWLPPSNVRDDMVFIKREYGPLGASHVRWEKNGYKIQVTQTRAVIAIKLEPLAGKRAATTQAEMEAYARDLCMKLFTDTFQSSIRENPPTDERRRMRIREVRAKIAEYSFECGLKRPVEGGLAGAAWKREFFPEGAKEPSEPGSLMWWHYLGWYTDGKMVAFWTFKVEGDSWWVPPACVVDPLKTWF